MNSFQLFTNALIHPRKLNIAKTMPFWKVVIYLLFLVVLLNLPLTIQTWHLLQTFQNDGEKIVAKLPTFEITDGQLETENDAGGFVYQTDTLVFTFDPEGKRSEQNLERDLTGTMIGVGFLKNKFVLVLPDSSITNELFGNHIITVAYTNDYLAGMTDQKLKELVQPSGHMVSLILLIFVVSLYPVFFTLAFDLLLLTLMANIYSRLRLRQLTLLENLKILVYAATLPTLVVTGLRLLQTGFPESAMSTLFVLLSLFVYSKALKDEPKISLPGK